MARIIKFRAWNQELEMMMPSVDLSSPLQNYKWLGRSDLPLMQFTGLLDKNGKEIYEGDILSHLVYRSWQSKDVVSFDSKTARFILLHNGKTQKQKDLIKYLEESEIIGNIYENKELLNNK